MRQEIKQENIILEAKLLKLLSHKKYFEQFVPYLDEKRLIPITAKLLKDYQKWYDKHNTDIDFSSFYSEFSMNWHATDLDETDLAYYRETVFPLIQNQEIDKTTLLALLEREASEKIQRIVDKGFDSEQINLVTLELEKQKQTLGDKHDDEVFSISGLDVSVLDSSSGLPWFLPSLQAGLQSHMPGQFVVVAADSDTGKSAFCISQAVHTFKSINARKETRPILYCTSEDTKEDLACRFLSCLYKDKYVGGFEQIVSDFKDVSVSYKKDYNDKLFIGMPIRSPADWYKLKLKVEKYNPCLIIIDMLDKMSNSDNIQDLTKLYQDVRGLANDGYAIIGTSQSGNTSYQDKSTGQYKHRRHLSDKDLSGSKSGKQGAAYCMIMIGKDDEHPSIRYIDTTKKKRGSHVSTTCEIVDKFSCYQELL